MASPSRTVGDLGLCALQVTDVLVLPSELGEAAPVAVRKRWSCGLPVGLPQSAAPATRSRSTALWAPQRGTNTCWRSDSFNHDMPLRQFGEAARRRAKRGSVLVIWVSAFGHSAGVGYFELRAGGRSGRARWDRPGPRVLLCGATSPTSGGAAPINYMHLTGGISPPTNCRATPRPACSLGRPETSEPRNVDLSDFCTNQATFVSICCPLGRVLGVFRRRHIRLRWRRRFRPSPDGRCGTGPGPVFLCMVQPRDLGRFQACGRFHCPHSSRHESGTR